MSRKVSWKSVRDRFDKVLEEFVRNERKDALQSGVAGSGLSQIGELLMSTQTQIVDMGTEKNKSREEVAAREEEKEQLGREIISMATTRRASQARKRQNATYVDQNTVNDHTTEDGVDDVEQVPVANNTSGNVSEVVNLDLGSPVVSNVNSNNMSQTQIEEESDIRSAVADRRKRRRESSQLSTGGSDLRSFGQMIKAADIVRADVEREKLTLERERLHLERNERDKDRSLQQEEQERRYRLESERYRNEQKLREKDIEAREKSDIEKMKLLLNLVKDKIKN